MRREQGLFIGIDKDVFTRFRWEFVKSSRYEDHRVEVVSYTFLFIEVGYVKLLERDEVKIR